MPRAVAGGVVGEPALQATLGEAQARSAELGRHRAQQVARLPQLLEVLVEEAILTVVHRGSFVEAGEHSVVSRPSTRSIVVIAVLHPGSKRLWITVRMDRAPGMTGIDLVSPDRHQP